MKFGVREILFALLLVGIPAGAWWFVLRPANIHQDVLREEVQAKQEKLQKLNRLIGSVGSLKKEIASLEKAIAFFQSKLPSEKEIDKVLQEIWRLAMHNSLISKRIRPQPRAKESFYTTGGQAEQPIVIELEGDFSGFYAFLQALEAQPRIMRISQMGLLKHPKAPEGHIKASFNMAVFFESNEGGQ